MRWAKAVPPADTGENDAIDRSSLNLLSNRTEPSIKNKRSTNAPRALENGDLNLIRIMVRTHLGLKLMEGLAYVISKVGPSFLTKEAFRQITVAVWPWS